MFFDPKDADTLVELLAGPCWAYLPVNGTLHKPGERVKLPHKLAKEYFRRGAHGEPPMVRIVTE
jgi:hypothetical protein